MMYLKKIKHWLPFSLVSLGLLFLFNAILKNTYQLYQFYTLQPREPITFPFTLLNLINVIFLGEYPDGFSTKSEYFKKALLFTKDVLLFKSPDHIGFITCIGLALIGVGTWLFSTRVEWWKSRWRDKKWLQKTIRWVVFSALFLAAYLTWIVDTSRKIRDYVLPFLHQRVMEFEAADFTDRVRPTGIQNLQLLDWVLFFIPYVPFIAVIIFMYRKWKMHEEVLREVFYDWKFSYRELGSSFDMSRETLLPDIILGRDIKTKEMVIQKGADRNLNNNIIGSIGTGKTATIIIPQGHQDMGHMVNMINNVDWKVIIEAEKMLASSQTVDQLDMDLHRMYEEEMSKVSNGVNGLVVIEPSNDLCQKIYQLALARNIPKEAIFYLNPLDENTVSINPLRGPIEKAVETFTMVIQGLAKDQEEFFKQSQRSHLKHYIYCLKLDKGNDATFDDLIEMYADARMVYEMVQRIEKTIPERWEEIPKRDERNHWMIVQGVVTWFYERGLMILRDRQGLPQLYPPGHKYVGKEIVVDKQAEYVQGLRNILDDLSASKLIRRVLFGKSDFDLDTHLRAGGILLCNTAVGELSQLSSVLGKFILLMTQNGIFRRGVFNVIEDGLIKKRTAYEKESFTHIIVDEFPDYIYLDFKHLPSQSRKYKAIITTASQSLAQLAYEYGDDFLYTLLSSFRHKMVLADVDPKSAKIFSEWFGDEKKYEQSFQVQTTPSMMSDPGRRDGVTTTEIKEDRFSVGDIIHLKEFQAAVKLVQDNRSMPVRVIEAVFVPKEEFKKAKVQVKDDQGEAWLEYRNFITNMFNNTLLSDDDIIREGKSNEKDAYPEEEIIKLRKQFRIEVGGEPLRTQVTGIMKRDDFEEVAKHASIPGLEEVGEPSQEELKSYLTKAKHSPDLPETEEDSVTSDIDGNKDIENTDTEPSVNGSYQDALFGNELSDKAEDLSLKDIHKDNIIVEDVIPQKEKALTEKELYKYLKD